MKKTISLLFTIFVLMQTNIYAQDAPSPAVAQIRQLIKSAKTDFKDDLGTLIQEDKENKVSYYETKNKTEGANTFIQKSANGSSTTMYIIDYDVEAMPTDMLVKFMPIVVKYVDELNVMAKSGNYTARDYTDDKGRGVTDIKDKDGKYVLRYASTKEHHYLYIYGPQKNK
jgi:hypothetical protein